MAFVFPSLSNSQTQPTAPTADKKKQQPAKFVFPSQQAAQPAPAPAPKAPAKSPFASSVLPQPKADTTKYGKLPGSGAYTIVVGKPNALPGDAKALQATRSQDALPAKKYSERDHIVPVSLGGTSDKQNLRDEPYSPLGKVQQFFHKMFENTPVLNKVFDKPKQPSYDTEMEALNGYKRYQETGGKEGLSLPQARLKVITFKQQQEAKQQGETQSVIHNFINEIPKAAASVARNIAGAITKPVAETVVGLVRTGQTLAQLNQHYTNKMLGKDVPEKLPDLLSKPITINVTNPVLKKVLTYGDPNYGGKGSGFFENYDKPVELKIDPVLNGQENFKQWISKVGSTGVNLGSLGYGGAEFKSGEIMANVAKKPLAELTAKELGAFAKAITVNKLIPGFALGGSFGASEAFKEGKSGKEVLLDTLHGGFSMALLELATLPLALRGKLKTGAGEEVIRNQADPSIAYHETPNLGTDEHGAQVLAKTTIDPLTKTAKIELDPKLKENPALASVVLDHEHKKIIEQRLGVEEGETPKIKKVKKVDPIYEEALKYDSPEAFRKALDINYEDNVFKGEKHPDADRMKSAIDGYYFHGTNATNEIKEGGFKKGEYFNSGAYFSSDPSRAIDYMKQNRSRDVGVKLSRDVIAVKLDRLKMKKISANEMRMITKNNTGAEEFVRELKSKKYDGVNADNGTEVLVWNTEKIKKPKTLTDIWNESRKPQANNVASGIVDEFQSKSGQAKEVTATKIEGELKALGQDMTTALETFKNDPEAFKAKAPTLAALFEAKPTGEIVSATSAKTLIDDSVEKIKKTAESRAPKTKAPDPVASQASEYATPEAFIKSQGKKIYHATDADFKEFDPGIAYRRTYGEEDYGTWFSTSKESIKDPNYPIIKEQVLKKDAKLISESKLDKLMNSKKFLDDPRPVHEVLMEMGYDGIDHGDGVYVLFDPNKSTVSVEKLREIHAESIKGDFQDHNSKLPDSLKMKDAAEVAQTREAKASNKREEFQSRVYDRLKENLPENLRDELTIKRLNLKEDADKAIKLIKKDPVKAARIAMQFEEPPKGQTHTAVNIALAEKALQDKNFELYGQLTKNRSLEQTRRGQEISAERGSVTDNSTERYVKDLIKARLDKLGKHYLDNVIDQMNEKRGKPTSRSQRGMQRIESEAKRLERKLRSAKSLDLEEAQKLIDSLACDN